MQPGIQNKAEILEVYNAYWDNYLEGNVPAMEEILHENYTQVGSAETEVFDNKKDAVQFLYNTIDQVAGKLDMRNRQTTLEEVGNLILVHESCDLFALADDKWIYYSRFRASTFMQHTDNCWKITHQHSSFPDTRTSDGGNIAIEKIAAENLQLREAVKRHTVDLEIKNRELALEASLERVRAVAMSMQQPTAMLDICKVIAAQLQLLGIGNIRNIQTAIFYETRGVYLNYEYFTLQDKTVVTEVAYNLQPDIKAFVEQMLQDPNSFFTTSFEGIKLKEWVAYQQEAGQYVDPKLNEVESLHYYFYSIGTGALGISTYAALGYDDLAVFKRFRNVFELAYSRFIDIEQAIAQAKEAEIELALEKVRSRSMAMHKSEELTEVIQVVYEQFIHLNINIEHTGFIIDYQERDDMHIWLADKHIIPIQVSIPYFDCAHWNSFKEAKQKGLHFFANHLSFQEKNKFYQDLFKLIPDVPQETLDYYLSCPGLAISTVLLENVGLYIENFAGIPYSDEENKTLMRFGNVFQQTYTRFLDLQKAEAQAIESQIQLALERVRARTMAMQKSDELMETAVVLFDQLNQLGENIERTIIGVVNEKEGVADAWATRPDGSQMVRMLKFPLDEPIVSQKVYAAWQQQKKSIVIDLRGEELERYFEFLKSRSSTLKRESFGERRVENFVFFSKGFLGVINVDPNIPGNVELYERFAAVFDQSYTRFLDLQTAEAQAKEGQVQLALERVRARTMAMQNSSELPEASNILFQQMQSLGMPTWSAGYCIWDDDKQAITLWMSSEGVIQPAFRAPTTEDELFIAMRTAFEAGQSFYVIDSGGEALAEHYQYMRRLPVVGGILDAIIEAGHPLPTYQIMHFAYFSHGLLLFITYEPVNEAHDIFKRFAKVFEQTYTRFLDLQKAEAQAREGQIQLALERVRARTMAMQRSEDLFDVIYEVNAQMHQLNFQFDTADFMTDYSDKGYKIWLAADRQSFTHPLYITNSDTKLPRMLREFMKRGDEFFAITLNKEEKNEYFTHVFRNYHPTNVSEETKQYVFGCEGMALSCVAVKNVILSICNFAAMPYSDAENEIIKRFGFVFEQSYTRFLDLKKAEGQAREAQIETALERVRSRTLAMQKSDELAETAAVLFKQLIHLGIEPNRLYITIVTDDTGEAEFWITDEDGSKVSAAYTSNLNDNSTFKKMLEGWRERRLSLIIDMQGEELQEYLKHLISLHVPFKDGLAKHKRVQHLAYFNKGFIGMASPDDQPSETIHLLERFAAVFNLTYTRFNDLKVAEAHATQAERDLVEIKTARKNAEEALVELQATQKQLIQSEKMASLGELTAGIAHEIQNPLNFVNNFSDVSNELMDEMTEELKDGNIEEAKAIALDIKQNLEKINTHGKRADAIVKGMLQHSRSSTGVKEPTEINALCDEYFRLAYHGLRAKDKSFNATMNSDFDQSVGKINIVSQDVGRVILNLISNAFYAVNERKKQQPTGYEPTVSVSTRKSGDKVLVTVKDNGNGISQKIVDKIFQPFFTTKPTGQGTGLGLSLAYDIVKAHAGEIAVETRAGEGSEFIISIPINLPM